MKIVEEKGYGKLVNFFEITEESFGNAIDEVLSNVTYVQIISSYRLPSYRFITT